MATLREREVMYGEDETMKVLSKVPSGKMSAALNNIVRNYHKVLIRKVENYLDEKEATSKVKESPETLAKKFIFEERPFDSFKDWLAGLMNPGKSEGNGSKPKETKAVSKPEKKAVASKAVSKATPKTKMGTKKTATKKVEKKVEKKPVVTKAAAAKVAAAKAKVKPTAKAKLKGKAKVATKKTSPAPANKKRK